MSNASKSGQLQNIDTQPGQNGSSQERPQQKSRSDQEQEGIQNPAGDTRHVDREPVDRPGDTQIKRK